MSPGPAVAGAQSSTCQHSWCGCDISVRNGCQGHLSATGQQHSPGPMHTPLWPLCSHTCPGASGLFPWTHGTLKAGCRERPAAWLPGPLGSRSSMSRAPLLTGALYPGDPLHPHLFLLPALSHSLSLPSCCFLASPPKLNSSLETTSHGQLLGNLAKIVIITEKNGTYTYYNLNMC